MKCPKYLINDGKIIFGKVEFHYQLSESHKKTKGGGWYFPIRGTKDVLLYDTSEDFKQATIEDVIDALKNSVLPVEFENCNFYYSTHERLDKALEDCTSIRLKNLDVA